MDADRFCALAPLLDAYPGAVSRLIERQAREFRAEQTPTPPPAPVPVTPPPPVAQDAPPPPAGARVIPGHQAALRMSEISHMFSFATVGADA